MLDININSRAYNALNLIAEQIPPKFSFIKEIRLFGSYAKKTNTLLSDLDILLILDERITDIQLRGLIREEIDYIAEQFSLDTDIIFYTEEMYNDNTTRFNRELKINKLIYKRR